MVLWSSGVLLSLLGYTKLALYPTIYLHTTYHCTITLTQNLENLLFELFRALCYCNGIGYWDVVAF